MQRLLIIVLAAFGAIAGASGLSGITLGPSLVPGGAPVPASVDSQYRFAFVFWLAAGVALLWSLFRLRERSRITQTALALTFAGGLARLVSAIAIWWPHPVFIATLTLELVGVPLVLWWHARIVRRHERTASGIAKPTTRSADG